MSDITQNTIVTDNDYWYIPLVSFKYRNGNDEIVTVETHVKEIDRNSHWIHGYMNGKSYPRNRIIGPIELLQFSAYFIKSTKTIDEIKQEIQNSLNKHGEAYDKDGYLIK